MENKEIQRPESLFDKLALDIAEDKQGISEDRINENLEELTKAFSFYREYPDLLLDALKDPGENFSFFFYQRMFIRAAIRHRYFFATFPRAYSKSFLSVIVMYLRCVLYPNSRLFIVAQGKEQACKIANEKLEEIWRFFPALKKEVDWDKSTFSRDYLKIVMKNGSYFDVVALTQSTRGGRRTGGLMEEAATLDGQKLSEIVIPMMNVSRRTPNGGYDPYDVSNKSQIYITTAGDKTVFAYSKMIQILLWSVIRPTESAIMGGSWRIPVLHGLLDRDFARDLQEDGTYTEESFSREYESIWSGNTEGAYFSGTEFDASRVLEKALVERPLKMPKGGKFIISYDVGRTSDQSSAVVFLIERQNRGTYIKKVVNIITFDQMHFLEQSIMIKKLITRYQAEKLIIDANGLGIGLIDFLTVPNVDESTGEEFMAMGVDRQSDEKGHYKKHYKEAGMFADMIYLIKANGAFNAEAHLNANAQISSGKVQFLISDKLAKVKLEKNKEYKLLSSEGRIEKLKPYVLTTLLKEEMMNLRKRGEGSDTALVRVDRGKQKDKFSAFEYGLWYIKVLERKLSKSDATAEIISFATVSGVKGGRTLTDKFKSKGGGRFGRKS